MPRCKHLRCLPHLSYFHLIFDYCLFILPDIYAGWIAQTLQADLLVETWQRKAHQLPSNCSLPYHVMNIKMVSLSKLATFSSYEDHSKWCISLEYQTQWTCIGDMNRESTQAWRGGGLICTQNPAVYKAFCSAVAWYKVC